MTATLWETLFGSDVQKKGTTHWIRCAEERNHSLDEMYKRKEKELVWNQIK